MAALNGTPERNPGLGPNPSLANGHRGEGNPATAGMDNFFENHFPHSPTHGSDIFNHPSTNRGGTPGILNGQPERVPGGLPTRPEFGPNPPKEPTRTIGQRPHTPVDVIVPRTSPPDQTPPHQRPRRVESASSREEHRRRQDLARHNRSGS